MPAQTQNTMAIGRGQNRPYRAKLVAMPSTSLVLDKDPKSLWGSASRYGLTIEFPAMPDTIELARSTDYIVSSSPFLPDGYHQYVSTKPLEIPVSFKLHALDQNYCKQGALTLLQIAARLHSFILPITNRRPVVEPVEQAKLGTQSENKLDKDSQKAGVEWQLQGRAGQGSLYPPVTCWLHLIWTDEGMPGISCVGYVKDVRVILHGPYLKGPDNSFNLPSAGEFSFTFVHRPGHNNSFGSISTLAKPQPGRQSNAYAHDVRDNFYNTRHLVDVPNYKGLDDGQAENLDDQVARIEAPTPPPFTNTEKVSAAVASSAVIGLPLGLATAGIIDAVNAIKNPSESIIANAAWKLAQKIGVDKLFLPPGAQK